MPKGAGLLALLPSGSPEGGSEGEGDGGVGGKEAALRDFFSAGKSGNWAAAAEAFQRAYDECAMAGELPEGEEY